MKRHLNEFLDAISNPAYRFVDLLKIQYLKVAKKPVSIKPKDLRHPVRLRSWLEFKILRSIVERGSYNFKKRVFAPTTILDAGANLGFSAVYFASRYPSAQICAVEAQRDNFEQLQRHCEPYSNITCLHAALSSEPGELYIADNKARLDAFQVTAATTDGGEPVQAVTVSSVMEQMGWSAISLLKMDIEGSEHDVFGSNYETWLEKVAVFAIEVHDSKDLQASKAVFAALAELPDGYRLRPRGENLIVENLAF